MNTRVQLEDVLAIIQRLEGDVHHLRQAIERACRPEASAWVTPAPLEHVERDHILDVLRQTGGNRMAAARALGISRRSLYRRLERHGIDYGARTHAATGNG